MPFDPKNIRVVSFDWGDTLLQGGCFDWEQVDVLRFQRLAGFLTTIGVAVSDDFDTASTTRYRKVKSDWKTEHDLSDCKELDEFVIFTGILDDIVPGWNGKTTIDAILDNFFDYLPGGLNFYSWGLPLLTTLKQRGYSVGILSQVSWPGKYCKPSFVREGLDEWIDAYSFSSDIGWHKPDGRHYRDFMDKVAATDPATVLHLGDSPLRDIVGAKKFGFRTALIRTRGIYPQQDLDSANPDLSLTSAEQLLDILPDRSSKE